MTGVRISAGTQKGAGRRVGPLLALVLLVVVHLAGSVHSATFTGTPVAHPATAGAHADLGIGSPPEHDHDHDHKADGHIDHALDRPRAAKDDTSHGLGCDGADAAVPVPAADAGLLHIPGPGPTRLSAAPHGPPALALHCVRRQ
ncbi:hypothetical protein [Streptomyces fuscichromogenes]|uniref:hypothetical protein n=1 Tax=Streptomyces fuscichromogenes TaxID=1324013 RepID=UPI00166FE399|nr:hypothetical protein [Streptomyces fuscichromogenes]